MEEVDNQTPQNITLYKDIIRLWEQGWEYESDKNNNKCKEAEKCFQEAKDKLDEALQFNNAEYIKLSTMVKLKIQGNEWFNKGIFLGNEANNLILENNTAVGNEVINVAVEKYKEAEKCLIAAQNYFTQGQEYNEYFKSCLYLVKKDLKIMASVIQDVENMMVENSVDINMVSLEQQFTGIHIRDTTGVEQVNQCVDTTGSVSNDM
ncbi:hypothetical protein [Rickettsia endosymbiont of Ceutorhynchus obstrictus]|uniref:hypothetical protein n=1 Tax=Rickettsia endosymbiont of Ceutorhynchus obstrictus TaxID=3066249 RepID=UPI0031330F2E